MWYDTYFGNIYTGGCCPFPDTSTMTESKAADILNRAEFMNVFARLYQDAYERYSFEGLPDTVSERVLKQALIFYGCVVFFEKEGHVFALPGGASDNFNIYGEPMNSYVWSYNGDTMNFPVYVPGGNDSSFIRRGLSGGTGVQSDRAVFVWENPIRFPFAKYIYEYAAQIADSMRTLEATRVNIKSPYIVTAEESLLRTVKQFFKEREKNVRYVVSSGKFSTDKVTINPLNIGTDYLKGITEMIEWYFGQWQLLCGYKQNTNTDKRAQLLTDEIDANDEFTAVQADKTLETLEYYIGNVNDVFGTSIRVVNKRKEEMQKEKEEAEDERNIDDVLGNGNGNAEAV